MHHITTLLLSIVLTLTGHCRIQAVSSPQPSGMLTRVATVDPHIVARAKEWFHRFQTGEIDRSQLSAQVNAQLTNIMIERETAKLKHLGNPTSFLFVRSYTIAGARGYDFLLQFEAARILEMIAFNPDDTIAGIDFQTFVPTSGESSSSYVNTHYFAAGRLTRVHAGSL